MLASHEAGKALRLESFNRSVCVMVSNHAASCRNRVWFILLAVLAAALLAVAASPGTGTEAQQQMTQSYPSSNDASSDALGDTDIGGVRLWLTRPSNPQGASRHLTEQGFVRRSGHQLMVHGAGADVPYYFVGFNAYWLNDKASWGHDWGRRQVAELLAAAQRLGLAVGRTWAFNSHLPQLPDNPGEGHPGPYSEEQFQALDYVIYAAGRYNLRLILALGNFWPAYFSPENWLYSAKGTDAYGLSILDFYNDSATRSLYKQHISTLVHRVNVFTGVKYKDDPAIFGFDVFNEPRCPMCPPHVLHSWMREVMSHLRYEDPNHLILMGTEGFFMSDPDDQLHQFNPGAGAQCEGEDWKKTGRLRDLDVSTMHVYERHMERRPTIPVGRSFVRNPDWVFCGFECYINWAVQYIQLHLEVNNRDIQKPVVIEEFGLTWWRSEATDMKVVVEVMRQILVHSAKTGGALSGVMFWSAAHNMSDDQDGYNVKIDRWPHEVPSSTVGIQYPLVPPILGSYKLPVTEFDGQNVEAAFKEREAQQIALDHGASTGRRHRSLTYQQDLLDGFRRGWQRGDCAHSASRTWRPMPINTGVVDVSALRAYTAQVDVVDLLARTCKQLQEASRQLETVTAQEG